MGVVPKQTKIVKNRHQVNPLRYLFCSFLYPHEQIHSFVVAFLSTHVSKELGLERHECESVLIAGLNHDIGKTRIPKELRDMERVFTNEDMETMKKHPILGAEILEYSFRVDGLEMDDIAIGATLKHHIGFNGEGYPIGTGIKPDIYSDILKICDCLDAGTDPIRFYNASKGGKIKTLPECMEEMARDAGTVYNPDVLETLFRKICNDPDIWLRVGEIRNSYSRLENSGTGSNFHGQQTWSQMETYPI